MKIFCQTGFPKTKCTDQGTDFTAQLTQAFQDVLGVSPRFSTPGHPESMGARNTPCTYWCITIPIGLWKTTIWTDDYFKRVLNKEKGKSLLVLARSVEEYLKQLQKKLQDAHEIASENSAKNQERMTSHYNLRSREKIFSVGDEVLILMPSSTHKLLNTWIGPAKVVKLTRPHSCLVRMEDGNTRELHVNKLRPYISRVDHVGIIFDQDTDFGELHYAPTDKENQPNIDIELNQMPDVLNAQQKYQLRNLLQRYEDIFRNRPGKARVKGHSVKVTADSSPKRLQPYRVPIALQKEVELHSPQLKLGICFSSRTLVSV
ncbi:retrovirus-related Pol polyprotein from transposon opus [Trichonephila clavata]|uniref:Retrovirus-related Pol polyprotein from transposon opus n=1 Tax=Trichonephila clavata TaxID=2740835 RepID=A0A8X6G3L9_TRICU|nr:retrovirus-related Pol polyprotein from transposon opus [Trichonephila clavata]